MLGKNTIEKFNLLEFESFRAFYNFDISKLKHIPKTIQIWVNDIEELDNLVMLLIETDLANRLAVIICFEHKNFKEFLEKSLYKLEKVPSRVLLYGKPTSNIYDLASESENARLWIQNHPTFVNYRIDSDNYIDMINTITNQYIACGHRFVDLEFDYESFDKIKFGDLHKLEFWFNHLVNWLTVSNTQRNSIVINSSMNFMKRIFISDDLYLYYNRNHFNTAKDDHLGKYLGDTQCCMEFMKYRDLSYENIIPSYWNRLNWLTVDYYANKNMMGNVNEIPYITTFINYLLTRLYK